jgi:hypothetical protein
MFTTKLTELEIRRKSYIFDPLNLKSLGPSLLINIIHWALLYFKFRHSSGTILLHYNVISGPDFVEKSRFVYFIPLIALVIFILNTILARYFYKKEKLAAYFLNFSNLAIQLIFLAASLMVISINAG